MKGLIFASHGALRGRSLLSLGSAKSTRKRRVESAPSALRPAEELSPGFGRACAPVNC